MPVNHQNARIQASSCYIYLDDARKAQLIERNIPEQNHVFEQYAHVNLEASNKLKVNSIVLLRNINNETKREPLRLARVDEIHESRDGS